MNSYSSFNHNGLKLETPKCPPTRRTDKQIVSSVKYQQQLKKKRQTTDTPKSSETHTEQKKPDNKKTSSKKRPNGLVAIEIRPSVA